MLCENCNERTATVHLTKIMNNKKTEIHLCELCAKESQKMTMDTPFSINSFLTSILDSIQDSPLKVDYIQTTECDHCKMTYSQFKNLGRLGCSHCYDAFKVKLNPLIKRVQGHEKHVGKIPEKIGGDFIIKREINELKKQLSKSIDKEEFEQAAVLRDKIRDLEKRLKGE
ncbi:UvrB/UvrC motif-containing protein [Anaeromicrobium sediminis]|uniref:UVR domain-containing protein n=1 Tax=Anaeromicrobium sediminis TaxID=1478221 RepID=A0A267MDJ6_9FIRM|nr:UvrB/UvrC motif-containing protein [Anaeromicrobium sediminis]PAB57537.1 hypothetical protein CCE28_18715 [Anaeromicrobium sediminis]